ncbi:RNA polymerase sigma factor [Halomonas sp. SpR8]|uniref:RNA polymerase sigma factor n=1 Tax=Halomonas sp. SpR8 TaxID=3050463 RepID=UPI0027E4C5D5|nr:RNA polymerase sigma factor [Halomonas sp. SpR8]MDQ7728862.1 RNA polymerase sigma factor [Halomonas sp. SpR8]
MTKPSSTLLRMFQNERHRLVKRIKQVVGSTSVAEDLAQDTFVKLWQRPPNATDTPGLLHRTAHNLALDYLRAQEVRRRHQTEELHTATEEPPQAPSPEQLATTLQQWQHLIEQLDTLSERAKHVFLLNRVEGETYTAIAERLGISISTVEKDMMRAMRLCREWQRQTQSEEDRHPKRSIYNNTSHSQEG